MTVDVSMIQHHSHRMPLVKMSLSWSFGFYYIGTNTRLRVRKINSKWKLYQNYIYIFTPIFLVTLVYDFYFHRIFRSQLMLFWCCIFRFIFLYGEDFFEVWFKLTFMHLVTNNFHKNNRIFVDFCVTIVQYISFLISAVLITLHLNAQFLIFLCCIILHTLLMSYSFIFNKNEIKLSLSGLLQ